MSRLTHHKPVVVVPSQMEVSSAIAAAKHASENVLIAQQQMIAAKENVLQQQKLAADREERAAIAQQKSEAHAAIQRSEATAAAQSVILAQQRLAATKATLSHQQKVAAAKEAQAATALQRTAHAASIEIQRTENEAAKLSTIHGNEAAAALHHVSATKDAALAPITNGLNRFPGAGITAAAYYPWNIDSAMTGAIFNPTVPSPPVPNLYNANPKPFPLIWG